MLVLSRKVGEQIVIGQGVTVSVLKVSGQRVQLGVVAPDDFPILREEVFQRIEPKDQPPAPHQPADSWYDVFA